MKYSDYINEIKPSSELKDKIRNNVKKELTKKKISKIKKIKGTITIAACFAVLIATTSVISNFSKHSNENTSVSTSENKNEKFITITEDDNGKSLPQEILINNVFYRQFLSYELKNKLEKNNGNFVIKESDVGSYICNINSDNIFNVDTQKIEDDEISKQNEFYNAKVYHYLPCNDLSNIVVKTADNVYLFHIVNLNNSVSINDLFELFSINNNNQVDAIEVWQDEIIDENITGFQGESITGTTVKEILTKNIKEKDKIDAVIQNFSEANSVKDKNDDIYYDIHRNKINESMSETGQYRLVFKLSNGLSFEFWICKDSKYFQAFESTYFELNSNNISKIIEIIKE